MVANHAVWVIIYVRNMFIVQATLLWLITIFQNCSFPLFVAMSGRQSPTFVWHQAKRNSYCWLEPQNQWSVWTVINSPAVTSMRGKLIFFVISFALKTVSRQTTPQHSVHWHLAEWLSAKIYTDEALENDIQQNDTQLGAIEQNFKQYNDAQQNDTH
jgi:hypothetical protein